MMNIPWKVNVLLILVSASLMRVGWAESEPKVLFEFNSPDQMAYVTPNEKSEEELSTTVTPEGLDVVVAANGKSSFPGVKIVPPTEWDASGYGRIEVEVTNTGTDPLRLNIRIENDAHWSENAWSGNAVTIQPGETKPLFVKFGHQYGKPAYPLQPDAIKFATIFTGRSSLEQRFRLGAITATGAVEEAPQP